MRKYVLGDRELSQVVANHLRLDLNLVELLTGVDTDDRADHLGDDNHVTEVGLDEVGLLVGLGLLLGLAELLDETHGLALQTAVEASAGTGVNNITELLGGKVEEPVKKVQSDQCPARKEIPLVSIHNTAQHQQDRDQDLPCDIDADFEHGERPPSELSHGGTGCEWVSKGAMISGNGNVLVEVNAAVRKLAELSSLLDLCLSNVQSAPAILL